MFVCFCCVTSGVTLTVQFSKTETDYKPGDEKTGAWHKVETLPDAKEPCTIQASKITKAKVGGGEISVVTPPGPLFRQTFTKLVLDSHPDS